jgi:hypothetical protein
LSATWRATSTVRPYSQGARSSGVGGTGREGSPEPEGRANREGLGGPKYGVGPNFDEFHDVHEDFEDEFTDTLSYGSDVFELDGDLYASAEEDGDDDAYPVDETSLKYLFCDSTWKKDHVTYDPEPSEFTGVRGNNYFWNKVPTMLQLFEIFWPHNVLRDIVIETNRYATEDLRGGKTYGGKPLTISGLKAFIAILLYMGMKRQPNRKSY